MQNVQQSNDTHVTMANQSAAVVRIQIAGSNERLLGIAYMFKLLRETNFLFNGVDIASNILYTNFTSCAESVSIVCITDSEDTQYKNEEQKP